MERIYVMHAECCKVFSHPVRLKILDCLREGKKTVNELTKEVEASQSNVSQHLSLMKEKGIVIAKRKGKYVYYKVTNEKILQAFDLVKDFLKEGLEEKQKVLESGY